jgi:hypothetical protein
VELHDEQQALVVERLRAANGAPVSYEELREMGVENPALLGYELAAVGLPVERRRTRRGAGALTLPVRPQRGGGETLLLAGGAPHRGDRPPAREPIAAGVADRAPGERRSERVAVAPAPRIMAGGLALAVLVAAVALALVLSGGPARTTAGVGSGHARGRRSATRNLASTGARRRHRTSDRPANGRSATGGRSSERAAGSAPSAGKQKAPVAVSPAAAATFEAEGHQLLTSGRYGAAIGDLRDAIEASGGSLASCSQPTTEACLTYAYALYDLGRALQLDGDPAAAIQVLNERLQIDNQREAVAEELELARRASA